MKESSDLKIAIVCDWLVGYGGAERVVLELHKMFPDAPIYTSQYDPKKIDWFKDADVRTTWLQNLPTSLRKFLPLLRAWSFSHLDLDSYDLVISSSGAEAKYIKTKGSTKHICYCHSPSHYFWIRYDEYIKNPGFGALNWLARLGLKLLVAPMRRWDYKAAQRPDVFIANSNYTKKNIKKYYSRDAVVIAPPVDINRFESNKNMERKGLITSGRQVPYKRFDLVVEACTKLDLPLTVVGEGPQHASLVEIAGPSINFVTGASDQDLAKLFLSAEAFIFPGQEDFGIVAVEALAAGLPVIAFEGGGALDYITPGENGIFFEPQSIDSLSAALKSFKPADFNRSKVKETATAYTSKQFDKKLSELLEKEVINE